MFASGATFRFTRSLETADSEAIGSDLAGPPGRVSREVKYAEAAAFERRRRACNQLTDKSEMYARVTTFHFQPGSLEEAAGIARDVLVPGLAAEADCTGAYFATKVAEDKAIAFSLWGSEQSAASSPGRLTSAQNQLARFMSFLREPAVTEVFEVRSHL